MRVLVCGPRDWLDDEYVWDVLDCFLIPRIKLLISGCADGVDAISCDWARSRKAPVLPFPARWHKHKLRAGPVRNAQMIEEGKPDLVFAFRYMTDDVKLTKGTANTVKQAERAGIKAKVFPRLPNKE